MSNPILNVTLISTGEKKRVYLRHNGLYVDYDNLQKDDYKKSELIFND